MHNNTVCKINLTVFGLSCVQKPLKNNRLLCRRLLLYLTCCNRFSLNWKTSESRAALHLRSLSTFLWISLQTYFPPPSSCLYLSFNSDGVASVGHKYFSSIFCFVFSNRNECFTFHLPHSCALLPQQYGNI